MAGKRRLVVALAGVAALSGCAFGLTFDPEIAQQGQTFTVSNRGEGQARCADDLLLLEEAGAADSHEMPVEIYLFSDFEALLLSPEPPQPVDVTTADEDGRFTSNPIPTPDVPGEHWTIAVCGGIPDDDWDDWDDWDEVELVGAADAHDGAQAIFIFDLLTVGQQPLSITVDPTELAPGGTSVATFSWCKNENDSGLYAGLLDELDELGDDAELAEVLALSQDTPTLDVFVDGELVASVDADERYPTGTVDVELTFDEEGVHDVQGVCRHQTFRWDRELLQSDLEEDLELLADLAAAQQPDYPVDLEVIVVDEADVASDVVPVTVAAPSPAPTEAPRTVEPGPAPAARAVTAAPTFTG